MGVCGSHWGLTNSNNTLTASFFLSAVHAYALCYLIWKARLKTSIIFWLLVTWHLSRHQILILRHSDFKVMFESLNCHIDIEIHFMYLDTYIIVQFIKKHPTRCNNVSNFFYSIFIWSSACFWRHTAHHQEPKTALAASGFSYVEGCWTCSWWHSVPDNVHQLHVQQPSTYEKTEAASTVLGSWWWAVYRPKHVELHINME